MIPTIDEGKPLVEFSLGILFRKNVRDKLLGLNIVIKEGYRSPV